MRMIMLASVAAATLFSAPAIAGTRSVTLALPGDYAGPTTPLKNEIGRLFGAQSPGSTLTIIEAPTGTTVARVALPDEARYRNPNVKARFQEAAKHAISHFIDGYAAARPAPSALPSQIALPVTLNAVAGNFVAPADDREILVIGSARYEDAREPQFSMRNAVPGDGLIGASEDQSPFGVANRHELLAGISVHYCLTERPADWSSPMIAARTERAWSLIIQGMGGRLSTFTPDLAACFDRLIDGKTEPARRYQLDADNTRLEMLTPAPERATALAPVARPVSVGPIARDAKPATPPTGPTPAAASAAPVLAPPVPPVPTMRQSGPAGALNHRIPDHRLPDQSGQSITPGRAAASRPASATVRLAAACGQLGLRTHHWPRRAPHLIEAAKRDDDATPAHLYSPRPDIARGCHRTRLMRSTPLAMLGLKGPARGSAPLRGACGRV